MRAPPPAVAVTLLGTLSALAADTPHGMYLPNTIKWADPPPFIPKGSKLAGAFVVNYLYLGYNTATAFSPTDALPLTPRAKMLMMLESTIPLATMVIVVSRAINAIP